MELDELRAAWQELDGRTRAIAAQIEWQNLNAVERRTSGFVRLCVFEIAAGIVAVLLAGTCLISGPRVPEFLFPALCLHVAAILTIVAPTWQLATLKTTDYSRPILEIQERLAHVRASRIRFTQGILLASPILWSLFLMVLVYGIPGLRAHVPLSATYIAANVLFGFAAIPILYLSARYIGRRFKGSRAMTELLDDMGGRSLSSALQDLDEISRFRETS